MRPRLVEYVQVIDPSSQFYKEVGAVIRKEGRVPLFWVLVHFKGTETLWFRALQLEVWEEE